MLLKQLPFITIPIVIFTVIGVLFVFVVPSGEDLISPVGDYYLGQVLVRLFFVCLVFDAVRLLKRVSKKK
jgi:hypothetical protein